MACPSVSPFFAKCWAGSYRRARRERGPSDDINGRLYVHPGKAEQARNGPKSLFRRTIVPLPHCGQTSTGSPLFPVTATCGSPRSSTTNGDIRVGEVMIVTSRRARVSAT